MSALILLGNWDDQLHLRKLSFEKFAHCSKERAGIGAQWALGSCFSVNPLESLLSTSSAGQRNLWQAGKRLARTSRNDD